MTDWERDHEEATVCSALGIDQADGFHIEYYGQCDPFWNHPQRDSGFDYPCIGPDNVYVGCLGERCASPTCWAGRLVAAAVHAPDDRLSMPRERRRGATCDSCVHAIEDDEGLIACRHGHFDAPITPPCLARKRIPASVDIPCPDYQRAMVLHPVVVDYRRANAERTARRCRKRAASQEPGAMSHELKDL